MQFPCGAMACEIPNTDEERTVLWSVGGSKAGDRQKMREQSSPLLEGGERAWHKAGQTSGFSCGWM